MREKTLAESISDRQSREKARVERISAAKIRENSLVARISAAHIKAGEYAYPVLLLDPARCELWDSRDCFQHGDRRAIREAWALSAADYDLLITEGYQPPPPPRLSAEQRAEQLAETEARIAAERAANEAALRSGHYVSGY